MCHATTHYSISPESLAHGPGMGASENARLVAVCAAHEAPQMAAVRATPASPSKK